MALIKEPLEVDFFVEPKPLSDVERATISDFIKNYKKKNAPKKKVLLEVTSSQIGLYTEGCFTCL